MQATNTAPQLSSFLLAVALATTGGLGATGCLAQANGGDEAELPGEGLDKSATTTDHGAIAPDFTYGVIANKAAAHAWTYATDERVALRLTVTRTDDAPRVAYVKIYKLTPSGRTEVYQDLGATDIVNEASPRVITFEPGSYELRLERYKATDATLHVTLGDADGDGQRAALPEYFFDLQASPMIDFIEEAAYGYEPTEELAAMRDEAIALAQIEDLDDNQFAVYIHAMMYGSFELKAVFASYTADETLPIDTTMTAGALFMRDLGDLETNADDTAWEAIRIIDEDDQMLGL